MSRVPTWIVHQLIALVFGVAIILPALIHLEGKLERQALANSERFSAIAGIVHAAAEEGR